MDSFRALNGRNVCQASGKRCIFICVLGTVIVIGLAIVIFSISYLHNNEEDGNAQESIVSLHQELNHSVVKVAGTKKDENTQEPTLSSQQTLDHSKPKDTTTFQSMGTTTKFQSKFIND
jgi:hypothetical protein